MTEYATIFTKHLEKYKDLQERERRVQVEKEGVMEMLKASFGMMSDDERRNFLSTMQEILEQAVKQEMGLTDAIRNLLSSNPKEWFNAPKVRDRMLESGFDFSEYISNPLASVHTVLKRFKRDEVTVRRSAVGIQEYRWIKPSLPPLRVATTVISPLEKKLRTGALAETSNPFKGMPLLSDVLKKK